MKKREGVTPLFIENICFIFKKLGLRTVKATLLLFRFSISYFFENKIHQDINNSYKYCHHYYSNITKFSPSE